MRDPQIVVATHSRWALWRSHKKKGTRINATVLCILLISAVHQGTPAHVWLSAFKRVCECKMCVFKCELKNVCVCPYVWVEECMCLSLCVSWSMCLFVHMCELKNVCVCVRACVRECGCCLQLHVIVCMCVFQTWWFKMYIASFFPDKSNEMQQ